MEFITWWLDEHYILSTIFTPMFTLIWCFYKGIVGRAIIAFIFCILGGWSSKR